MSYKYPNIVQSISNDREAHERFRKCIERRTDIYDPTNYGYLLDRIAENLHFSVRDDIDLLRGRNHAGRGDKIPQDLWDELLEEFGYLETEENAEEKLIKLICGCPKAWAHLCDDMEIRKKHDIPLTYTPGAFTLRCWTSHIPAAEKVIDNIKDNFRTSQTMWDTLLERYKAQTDPAGFSTPSPTPDTRHMSQVKGNITYTGLAPGSIVTHVSGEPLKYNHVADAMSYAQFNTLTQPKEDKPMTVTVETKHLVNGQNVKDMSDNELLMCVQSLENELEDLDELKTQSKFIEKRKKELGETLKTVVKHLDGRA